MTAEAAPFHGHFIICSDPEYSLKMTADLSDGKGEKVATAVQNGLKLLFPESTQGRIRHRFSFYGSKKTPLTVTPSGQKDPEIRLTFDPGQAGGPELLHQRTDPFLYRISRYTALLSIHSFRVIDRKVTCTESQWESD
jgi:hypothetical protein